MAVFDKKEVHEYVRKPAPTYSDVLKELQGILNYRRRSYPDAIRMQKLDPHLANYKIACLEKAIEKIKFHSKQTELFGG